MSTFRTNFNAYTKTMRKIEKDNQVVQIELYNKEDTPKKWFINTLQRDKLLSSYKFNIINNDDNVILYTNEINIRNECEIIDFPIDICNIRVYIKLDYAGFELEVSKSDVATIIKEFGLKFDTLSLKNYISRTSNDIKVNTKMVNELCDFLPKSKKSIKNNK